MWLPLLCTLLMLMHSKNDGYSDRAIVMRNDDPMEYDFRYFNRSVATDEQHITCATGYKGSFEPWKFNKLQWINSNNTQYSDNIVPCVAALPHDTEDITTDHVPRELSTPGWILVASSMWQHEIASSLSERDSVKSDLATSTRELDVTELVKLQERLQVPSGRRHSKDGDEAGRIIWSDSSGIDTVENIIANINYSAVYSWKERLYISNQKSTSMKETLVENLSILSLQMDEAEKQMHTFYKKGSSSNLLANRKVAMFAGWYRVANVALGQGNMYASINAIRRALWWCPETYEKHSLLSMIAKLAFLQDLTDEACELLEVAQEVEEEIMFNSSFAAVCPFSTRRMLRRIKRCYGWYRRPIWFIIFFLFSWTVYSLGVAQNRVSLCIRHAVSRLGSYMPKSTYGRSIARMPRKRTAVKTKNHKKNSNKK